jgi:hypothetical protein
VLVPRTNVDANVTSTWSTPRSQCSAVRKTCDEISVPVHSSHVPSENACGASSAPTSGCAFPSGTPFVIALPAAAKTSAAESATKRLAFRM